MTLTVLLTGFGPFPGAPVNPTTALVRRLVRRRFAPGADVRCIGHVFATRYATVDHDLPALIARHRPDAVVMFGLAARRSHVGIETAARNRASTVLSDAGGAAHASMIEPRAIAHRRGRAPMQALLAAARRARVDARLSRDAGRYVCNYLYWRALEAAERAGGPRVAVFVHVPRPRRMAARVHGRRRACDLPDLVRAGEEIVRAVIAAARRPH